LTAAEEEELGVGLGEQLQLENDEAQETLEALSSDEQRILDTFSIPELADRAEKNIDRSFLPIEALDFTTSSFYDAKRPDVLEKFIPRSSSMKYGADEQVNLYANSIIFI
jgi:hypothetical protein